MGQIENRIADLEAQLARLRLLKEELAELGVTEHDTNPRASPALMGSQTLYDVGGPPPAPYGPSPERTAQILAEHESKAEPQGEPQGEPENDDVTKLDRSLRSGEVTPRDLIGKMVSLLHGTNARGLLINAGELMKIEALRRPPRGRNEAPGRFGFTLSKMIEGHNVRLKDVQSEEFELKG